MMGHISARCPVCRPRPPPSPRCHPVNAGVQTFSSRPRRPPGGMPLQIHRVAPSTVLGIGRRSHLRDVTHRQAARRGARARSSRINPGFRRGDELTDAPVVQRHCSVPRCLPRDDDARMGQHRGGVMNVFAFCSRGSHRKRGTVRAHRYPGGRSCVLSPSTQ